MISEMTESLASRTIMTAVQQFAADTLEYLEQDLKSFEAVLRDGRLPGKLGVAMITNATAALDLFAWLLYQSYDQRVSNGNLFKKISSDERFFPKNTFIHEALLYGIVRCGVVHQFYPKNIAIVAVDREEPFLQDQGRLVVNCLGFYRKVVDGLRRVREHIRAATGADLDRLDFMLALRQRLDESAREGVPLDTTKLPQLKG